MPRVFVHDIVVPPEAIDELGHVSNVVYVRWMQDVAVAHSAAQGWSLEHYVASGGVWVAMSHSIRYRRPAMLGETVRATTWISEVRRMNSRRRYTFRRLDDGVLLAEAETVWAYIDHRSGRPRPLSPEVMTAFEVVTPAEEAQLRRHT